MKTKRETESALNEPDNCLIDVPPKIAPLLVDANAGAEILGVSPPTFYKFIRKNAEIPVVELGSLHRWNRWSLLRLAGKKGEEAIYPDILVDAKIGAVLCSVSRPMFYKLNKLGVTPKPIMTGRTLRWSLLELYDWIEHGCPPRRKQARKQGRK